MRIFPSHKLPITNYFQRGFTLIELIVVVAVIGLALPALFAIVFSVLQQQVKVLRLSEIKRQGDTVLNIMTTAIRSNAVKIYADNTFGTEYCSNTTTNSTSGATTGTNFFFRDKSDRWFQYYLSGTALIADTNGDYLNGNLTTSKVRIENFSISCIRGATYTGSIVTVQFDICYNNAACASGSARNEEIAKLTYKTQVKLRNFQ